MVYLQITILCVVEDVKLKKVYPCVEFLIHQAMHLPPCCQCLTSKKSKVSQIVL